MKNNIRKIAAGSLSLILLLNIFLSQSDYFIVDATDVKKVTVGGAPFGVKFYSEGIIIVGFCEVVTEGGNITPAYDAGLRVNDKITHVNGREIKTAVELINIIGKTDGEVNITYERNGEEAVTSFTPAISSEDGQRRTGMWVRDTTAGIGTVTFVEPESGMFAGLGHGICDTETGKLLELERGIVVDVCISGITKGVAGTPGELRGYFTSDKSGVLLDNTTCGVFGVFTKIPDEMRDNPRLEVADRSDVNIGPAKIMCTVEDGQMREYSIEIKEINPSSKDNRSFLVEITDEELLSKTGGIVQGMSGSPIIQNGKLIGAVTHVLINDPTRGYGIFIENMLEAVK